MCGHCQHFIFSSLTLGADFSGIPPSTPMEETPVLPALQTGCLGLEHYLVLAKTATGQGAVELVNQILDAPGVYVFGEFLETECLKQLAVGPHAGYAQLMQLFAYGTFSDYKSMFPCYSR